MILPDESKSGLPTAMFDESMFVPNEEIVELASTTPFEFKFIFIFWIMPSETVVESTLGPVADKAITVSPNCRVFVPEGEAAKDAKLTGTNDDGTVVVAEAGPGVTTGPAKRNAKSPLFWVWMT